MRLDKASSKAIKYACLNFHYAKRLPIASIGFSVFEDNQWCGVILFNRGNIAIEKPYCLSKGSVLELIRVALNGKQSSTSKALSISLRLLSSIAPLTKLVVSYADQEEGHKGIIYQATNWFYEGEVKSVPLWVNPKTSKRVHDRNVTGSGVGNAFGKRQRLYRPDELIKKEQKPKHKYIYPLDKSLIPLCKSLAKPYPKKQAQEVLPVARLAPSQEEGFDSTPALKSSDDGLR